MRSVEYYIRGLFRDVEQTPQVVEQREELTAHIIDRITDAMAGGIDEDTAFEQAIASLGNLDELMDTITGRRKRVQVKRVILTAYLIMFCWGTLYMIGVGLWFSTVGEFGNVGWFVAIPGWIGYLIPAAAAFGDWLRHRGETEVVSIDISRKSRHSFAAFILISAACFAINLIFMQGHTFLHVFWSWMPAAGMLSFPLYNLVYGYMLRKE